MELKDIVVNGKVVGREARFEGEMRKAITLPAISPTGRTPREGYRCVWMRSTKREPLDMQHSRIHYGPYIAFWETNCLVPNPQWKRTYPETVSMWLEKEYVVTQHDEDEGVFEELLRTTNEDEAKQFFNSPDFQHRYPETDWPRRQGGVRDGAGRPSLGGKLVGVDMPDEMIAALNAKAKKRGVARAELVRDAVQKFLDEDE